MNFQKIKISGWQFELSDDFPAGFPSDIMDSTSFMDGRRSPLLKLPSSKFANVFKLNIYFKGRIYSLILKQYLNRSILDIFKNLLRSCRAQRAYEAGLMLKQHGFSSPDIAVIGQKTFAGITAKNFLITGEIKDAAPLYKMLDTDTSQKQQLISRFGQTVGRMHAQNIFHGDLRLGNVLVKKDDSQFIFLDNERTRKFKKLPQGLRLKNLVQVCLCPEYISDADRTIFLDAYLSQQNVKIDRKKLAAQVAAGVKKRLAAKGVIANEPK
jgi:tRNA A-37 threonylcarbamoyl transferase component Bud32